MVALEDTQHGRKARTADAVKAEIAPADEVAVDLARLAIVAEADLGPAALEIVHAYVLDLEQNLLAVGEEPRDDVFHHLLLAVDRHTPVDQLAEVEVVQRAVEVEEDAAVEHALAQHAVADAELGQEVGDPLLEQTSPDAVLDVLAAAILDDDRIDARATEQQRQHEPGGACAHDPDLGTHRVFPPAGICAVRRLSAYPRSRGAKGTGSRKTLDVSAYRWPVARAPSRARPRRSGGPAQCRKCKGAMTVD